MTRYALILALAAGGADANGGGVLAACNLVAGPERTVARVVTGDTLILDDGSRVRLANVLVPRAADVGQDGQLAAERAALAALDQAARGKAVRLRFDTARTDRHGTLRAHVMLVAPGAETWVQARLLADGHARVDARIGERSCVGDLLAAEDVARANAAGLWVDSAHRVRAALPARDLAGYRGTFQIITGKVHSVESSRDLWRLLLGPDRRRDVSVSLRANDRDVLGGLGGDAQALVGKTIEARGWLDQRAGSFGGPDIDVSLAGHIRLVP
jgi:micrococcal nuclease